MQMMLNMMRSRDDRSASTQLRLQKLARAWSGPSRNGRIRQGASVRGWAMGLMLVGSGPYRVVGADTIDEALLTAARAMRKTARPVGLLVWRGRHAWVMSGFRATRDPLVPGARVTQAIVEDPLYPYGGSTTWGRSPRPGEALSVATLGHQFVRRRQSTFNAQDPANQDRFAMLEVGARIVRDHPLLGVGPNMVPQVYEQYRPDYAVNPTNPHLHNVPMQIAAERGLPALGIWIWLMAALALALVRQFNASADRVLSATALAAVAAMLVAGLFEYNFGDSEFLMLFLVLVTLPFAVARGEDGAATDRA